MKSILPLLIAISLVPVVAAQESVPALGNASDKSQQVFDRRGSDTPKQAAAPKDQEEEVVTMVEEMPVFPGGQEALFRYLGTNIRYPRKAINADIQGSVVTTFVVERDGTISKARVLRGIGGGCDEEALRVVRSMPAWTPGKQRGEAVRVQYNLPIRFTLAQEEK